MTATKLEETEEDSLRESPKIGHDCGRTRQDKTRQDKTRQDKTRQDKTKHNKIRQEKTQQNKTKHMQKFIKQNAIRIKKLK